MSSPLRCTTKSVESTERSPKNFRWTPTFDETLLDLLLRETRKGNRPDKSFTATAFRNIVKDFNRTHGTNILKKNVQNRIKTMKQHFVLFHGAFNGLSGFAWNQATKMFEAEDSLWEQRILENPKLEKLRDKACLNWDKLFELYGDTRANGTGACGLKDMAKTINRGLELDDLDIGTPQPHSPDVAGIACSSYGEHDGSRREVARDVTPEYGSTQQSGGSSHSKLKRKASLISVMEEGYKTMAASIDKLSMAVIGTGETMAGNKFDISQNALIYDALSTLGLEEQYSMRCYKYLCAHPSKAALMVAAPIAIRGKILEDIMSFAEDA